MFRLVVKFLNNSQYFNSKEQVQNLHFHFFITYVGIFPSCWSLQLEKLFWQKVTIQW